MFRFVMSSAAGRTGMRGMSRKRRHILIECGTYQLDGGEGGGSDRGRLVEPLDISLQRRGIC